MQKCSKKPDGRIAKADNYYQSIKNFMETVLEFPYPKADKPEFVLKNDLKQAIEKIETFLDELNKNNSSTNLLKKNDIKREAIKL